MEHLPLELIQRVLVYLDLSSLRNAALSCRTFLEAFQNAEIPITSDIILRQIDISVLPEAILVYKSWQLGRSSIEAGTRFAEAHLRSRTLAPSQWRIADALPLARFHRFVEHFANDFANNALERQPCLRTKETPGASCSEISRFQRAFYRFQLYCNVVGQIFPVQDDQLRTIFFSHFAAWENEQLACVHDYLVRVVAEPFNYLVDHDVTLGYLKVPYIDCHSSHYGQQILSEGLEKIYSLAQATTYQNQKTLLSQGDDRSCEPSHSSVFLHRGLEKGANVFPIYPESLSELDDEDRKAVIGSPWYDDPDVGPASIWEWVHQDQLPGSLVGNASMIHHRQWAYAFWSLSRLENAGLLDNPSISGRGQRSELELDEYSTTTRSQSLEKSQNARARIWSLGGSGWWSAADQTKVI